MGYGIIVSWSKTMRGYGLWNCLHLLSEMEKGRNGLHHFGCKLQRVMPEEHQRFWDVYGAFL
jgi:hypothetical protein